MKANLKKFINFLIIQGTNFLVDLLLLNLTPIFIIVDIRLGSFSDFHKGFFLSMFFFSFLHLIFYLLDDKLIFEKKKNAEDKDDD